MKNVIAAAVALTLAVPAFAGNPMAGAMDATVIEAEASSSSNGSSVIGLGLLLAILIAAD